MFRASASKFYLSRFSSTRSSSAAAVTAASVCAPGSAFSTAVSASSTSSSFALTAPAALSTSVACLTTGPDHWYEKEQEERKKAEAAAAKKEEMKQKASGLPMGCVRVDALNLDKEVMRSEVPTLLYFHVTSHPEVAEYTRLLTSQVGAMNREALNEAPMTQAHLDPSKKIAIKLGMINCEKEVTLAQQFRISGSQFPMTYFMINGSVVDQAVGIMDEVMIRDALKQFVDYAAKRKAEGKGESRVGQAMPGGGGATPGAPDKGIGRIDEDDENPVTLLQVALRKLQEKDFTKCTYLLDKAEAQAKPEVDKLKQKLGYGIKKVTPEMLNAMRKDPNVMVVPQILCARAMMALAQNQKEQAFHRVDEVVRDFPWAPRDLRQVADCVCRVRMIQWADFDSERDNYVTLMKNSDNITDPIEFYFTNTRLAICHYFERHTDRCVEELLRLIRAETKLMPALKKAGLIEAWSKLGSTAGEKAAGAHTTTLARRLIFLVFEAVGNDNQMVIAARKKLAAYL